MPSVGVAIRSLGVRHKPHCFCATATVQVNYPQAIPAGAQYWKYGPTAAQPAPHWYALASGVPNNLVISGATATFTITDGGLGDDDLTQYC